jgi:hypothetical protein
VLGRVTSHPVGFAIYCSSSPVVAIVVDVYHTLLIVVDVYHTLLPLLRRRSSLMDVTFRFFLFDDKVPKVSVQGLLSFLGRNKLCMHSLIFLYEVFAPVVSLDVHSIVFPWMILGYSLAHRFTF